VKQHWVCSCSTCHWFQSSDQPWATHHSYRQMPSPWMPDGIPTGLRGPAQLCWRRMGHAGGVCVVGEQWGCFPTTYTWHTQALMQAIHNPAAGASDPRVIAQASCLIWAAHPFTHWSNEANSTWFSYSPALALCSTCPTLGIVLTTRLVGASGVCQACVITG
jgi:hypothetical protein